MKVMTAVFACCVATAASVLCAETNTVAKTMTVVRCQYVIEDGRQCVYQAEKGTSKGQATQAYSTPDAARVVVAARGRDLIKYPGIGYGAGTAVCG